jgi:hypothetical protein
MDKSHTTVCPIPNINISGQEAFQQTRVKEDGEAKEAYKSYRREGVPPNTMYNVYLHSVINFKT